jgi:MFS family permease
LTVEEGIPPSDEREAPTSQAAVPASEPSPAPFSGWGRESMVATASILGFALALSSAGLVVPLLAVAAGYDFTAVGILTAVSAISQLGFRLLLPWLLTRFPDRTLIVAANVMIAASFLVLLANLSIVAFAVAQLLQGAARALFWTASQTHAVRGRGGVVRSLALVQTMGNVGQLAGPPVAGLIASQSLQAALVFAAVLAIVGLVSGIGMATLPTFPRQDRAGQPRIWRRPGVDLACWASYSAGGWRAMLMSFVPVGLAAAGQPPEVIGFLLMAAEGSGLAATALLLRRRPPDVHRALQLAVLFVAASLIVFPIVTGSVLFAALTLAVGGVGSGLLMSLGPALASESVAPEERGEVLAVAGTFRAVALLVTHAAAAAALTVVTLPIGLLVAAVAIGAPPIVAGLRRASTSVVPA